MQTQLARVKGVVASRLYRKMPERNQAANQETIQAVNRTDATATGPERRRIS